MTCNLNLKPKATQEENFHLWLRATFSNGTKKTVTYSHSEPKVLVLNTDNSKCVSVEYMAGLLDPAIGNKKMLPKKLTNKEGFSTEFFEITS